MTAAAEARVVSGVCRYAAARPPYADFHRECPGNWRVTVAGPGGGTVSGRCDCRCHREAREPER